MTLGDLRQIIFEEVQRNMRWTAGFGGSAGIAGRGRGSIEQPPPGLGGKEEQSKEHGEEEEWQFAVKVDRRSRKRRQD